MNPDSRPSYGDQMAAVLSRLPVYRHTSEAQRALLSRKAVLVDLRRGQALFQIGDVPRNFHAVVQGTVHFVWSAPGASERRVAYVLGPGDPVADAAALLQAPYKINAEASCDSEVLAIPREAVLAALHEGGPFAQAMLERTSRFVLDLVHEIEALTLRTGVQRVACFLLDAAPGKDESRYEVLLPVSKGTLASRLNITKESLSRILKGFRDDGTIDVAGRVIIVQDKARLCAVGRRDSPMEAI